MNTVRTKICKICKHAYESTNSNQKYCNAECGRIASNQRHADYRKAKTPTLASKICYVCNQNFLPDYKRQRTCKAHEHEDKLELARKWRKANPEKCNNYSKTWRNKNKDRVKASAKRRLAKPEQKAKRAAIIRNYRRKHPDKAKEYSRRYREKHHVEILSRNRRRKQNLENMEGSHTQAEWDRMLVIYNYQCACCGVEGKLTRDHIRPVSKGGSDYISNIQPLCIPCNSKKGAKEIKYELAS